MKRIHLSLFILLVLSSPCFAYQQILEAIRVTPVSVQLGKGAPSRQVTICEDGSIWAEVIGAAGGGYAGYRIVRSRTLWGPFIGTFVGWSLGHAVGQGTRRCTTRMVENHSVFVGYLVELQNGKIYLSPDPVHVGDQIQVTTTIE